MIAKRTIWALALLAAGGLSLAWTSSASAGWGYYGGGSSFSIQTPRTSLYIGNGGGYPGGYGCYQPYNSFYRPPVYGPYNGHRHWYDNYYRGGYRGW